MKAENILKCDVLDIIFQNKNKDYGAYQLRKFYPNRLKKSIAITILLVLIFAGLQSWKTPKKSCEVYVSDVIELIKYIEPIEKEKENKIEKLVTTKKVNQLANTIPIIVIDTTSKTTVPNQTQIDTSNIGTTNIFEAGKDALVGVETGFPSDGVDVGKRNIHDSKNAGEEVEEPILFPSKMPEFPGGVAALKNFMERNLRQPDDIDEGQQIVIWVKFKVDKNGNISDVQIIQNGREDLDDEVIRVVNKMPNWNPGLQNGLPVAVYFRMPITFINNN